MDTSLLLCEGYVSFKGSHLTLVFNCSNVPQFILDFGQFIGAFLINVHLAYEHNKVV